MTNHTTKVIVLWTEISIMHIHDTDFISLTDMVKKFWDDAMIYSRMRNRNTVQFIGTWELLHNPDFKGNEFETFKKDAWLHNFNLTPRKWIQATNAIGMSSKAGRYGWGTFAHKDIAFEFASWLSPEFKLYLIKDYQRLKDNEQKKYDRDVKRLISKVNYKIHTDAIQQTLIPKELTTSQKSCIYADEADMLNVALFWQTAKQRRSIYTDRPWNMRDYATIEQLIVLSNMESINAELIRQQLPQSQRVEILNTCAIQQMKSLVGSSAVKNIEGQI